MLKVFDGDGFLTRIPAHVLGPSLFGDEAIDVAVRFGFVDAPEIDQPGGAEARDFLTFLIGGRTLRIDILTKMDTGRSVDRYGRLVCVPYVQEEYDHCTFATRTGARHRMPSLGQPIMVARNVELEMVLNGWAWVMDRYGPDDRYYAALEDARRDRRGIWALPEAEDPWAFKRRRGSAARAAGTNPDRDPCPAPDCFGHLVRRNGKYGEFLGCSQFPICRFSGPIPPA